jgi:hypothetical protein
MSQLTYHNHGMNGLPAQDVPWNVPVRLLHWLTAGSLAGAVFLTSQGDFGHALLGWVALGVLLFRVTGFRKRFSPGPAIWIVTASVVVLVLSGQFAPLGTVHLGATLIALVLAAFYCATVLFESLQRIIRCAAERQVNRDRTVSG